MCSKQDIKPVIVEIATISETVLISPSLIRSFLDRPLIDLIPKRCFCLEHVI